MKIKGSCLLSHLFASCSLLLIYLQKHLRLLLTLERMLEDKRLFSLSYRDRTESKLFSGVLSRTVIPVV